MKKATYLVAILAVGFAVQSCSSVKKIDSSKLAGHWVLQEINGEKVSDIHTGATPTMEFDVEKNSVSGSSGCNSYIGGFTLSETNEFAAPALAGTLKMCMDAKIEDSFLGVLREPKLVMALDEKKELLTFSADEKVALVFKKGEKESFEPLAINAETLSGDWKLINLTQSDIVALFGDKAPTMTLTAEGKVHGFAGCNNFNTTYEVLEGDVLKFGLAATTMMACEHLEGEAKFTTALASELKATLVGKNLKLTNGGVIILEFVKVVAE